MTMFMIMSNTAQAAATPVEIFTSHQNSERLLEKARINETGSTTRAPLAQIATRVSKVNNLECESM